MFYIIFFHLIFCLKIVSCKVTSTSFYHCCSVATYIPTSNIFPTTGLTMYQPRIILDVQGPSPSLCVITFSSNALEQLAPMRRSVFTFQFRFNSSLICCKYLHFAIWFFFTTSLSTARSFLNYSSPLSILTVMVVFIPKCLARTEIAHP